MSVGILYGGFEISLVENKATHVKSGVEIPLQKCEELRMLACYELAIVKPGSKKAKELEARLKEVVKSRCEEAKKKLPWALKRKEEQGRLDELVDSCTVFADRKGKALDRGSNPFSSHVELKYSGKNLEIHCRVQISSHSNGSCTVTVRRKKMLVFKANSNYTARPFNTRAIVYKPGDWETPIRKFAKNAPDVEDE